MIVDDYRLGAIYIYIYINFLTHIFRSPTLHNRQLLKRLSNSRFLDLLKKTSWVVILFYLSILVLEAPPWGSTGAPESRGACSTNVSISVEVLSLAEMSVLWRRPPYRVILVYGDVVFLEVSNVEMARVSLFIKPQSRSLQSSRTWGKKWSSWRDSQRKSKQMASCRRQGQEQDNRLEQEGVCSCTI